MDRHQDQKPEAPALLGFFDNKICQSVDKKCESELVFPFSKPNFLETPNNSKINLFCEIRRLNIPINFLNKLRTWHNLCLKITEAFQKEVRIAELRKELMFDDGIKRK